MAERLRLPCPGRGDTGWTLCGCAPSDRRPWYDGAAVDEEGCLWKAFRNDVIQPASAHPRRPRPRRAARRRPSACRSSDTGRRSPRCWPPGEDGVALGRGERPLPERASSRPASPPPRSRPGKAAAGVALAAVGSFGRGAVALRSDADVVLVVEQVGAARRDAAAFAEALLYPLWDATLAGRPPGAERRPTPCRSRGRTSPRRRRCSTCACSRATTALLRELVDRAPARASSARSDLDALHRPPRGRGRRAPRALRRVGVPARAGREERRRAACAISTARGGRRAPATAWARPEHAQRATPRPMLEGPLATWGELVRLGVMQSRGAGDRRGRGVSLARAQPPARARRAQDATGSASRSRRRSRSRWATATTAPTPPSG